MTQAEKATLFKALHIKGNPVILYNIWDAGSAKAVEAAGAKAFATGSASVAGAQGYGDGEAIPLDMVDSIIRRITETTDLPLTVDFEGAYAADPAAAAENVAQIIKAGAIGINFEDQIVGTDGYYDIDQQSARIRAIRQAADTHGIPDFFINARTDLFLKNPDKSKHAALLSEAKERAAAYAEAGASGFFAPLLGDEALIADLCETCSLPVNIMAIPGTPPLSRQAELGVSRISFGPVPWRQAMAALTEAAKIAYSAPG